MTDNVSKLLLDLGQHCFPLHLAGDTVPSRMFPHLRQKQSFFLPLRVGSVRSGLSCSLN